MPQQQISLLKGVGVGLRTCHYQYIEKETPDIPWFEVLSDNYLCEGGPSLRHLERICSSYPVTLHGVGMSLGSTDPLNFTYLKKLKSLIHAIEPILISDHLCWTSFAGQYFHELLPLPYTEEAVMHVAKRIGQVQDYLKRQIMIENVSCYLSFEHSTLQEWEFLQAVCEEANCLTLLDINNVYVSACNNEFNAIDYLNGLSEERIVQFHLAGFENRGTHLLDTHSFSIDAMVWKLFEYALKKFGPIPTVIEWDNNIPDFLTLQQEALIAQKLVERYASLV
jgi:uncharacterized protein (UPF0276 family)